MSGFSVVAFASAAVLATAAGGCFSPTFAPGDLTCPDQECPDGLVCDRGVCVVDPAPGACGDGIVNGPEVCDDGNTNGGDGCAENCDSGNCLVPLTHPTIAAVLADSACPIGYVASGTYRERITIDGDRSLIGIGQDRPVIDGDGMGTVVEVASGTVSIERLIVTGGLAAEGGGIVNRGALTLRSVDVTGNAAVAQAPATSRGGGILHLAGSLDLEDSKVRDNTLDAQGMADFELWGGGIYATAPVSLGQGSQVSGNRIDKTLGGQNWLVFGVGIAVVSSSLTLDGGSEVSENSATFVDDTGGNIGVAVGVGLYAESSTVACTACSFDRNVADIDIAPTGDWAIGGAIYVSESSISMATGATMSDNRMVFRNGGSGRGAGLYAASSTVILNEASVTGNAIEVEETMSGGNGQGAAFLLAGDSPFEAIRTVVSGNRIVGGDITFSNGAGFHVSSLNASNPLFTLSESTVADNTIDAGGGRGGGLYADVGGAAQVRIHIHNTTFSGNVITAGVSSGGGLHLESGGSLGVQLDNCTISGNVAATGAGVNVENQSQTNALALRFRMSFTTITANGESGGTGSGLRLLSDVADPLFESTFGLIAGNFGAGSDCETSGDGELEATFTLIDDNACTLGGVSSDNIIGTSIMLGPLADNGGPTQTHAISAGPAVDAAAAPCFDLQGAVVDRDQRGLVRPVGGSCDIGSFELQ